MNLENRKMYETIAIEYTDKAVCVLNPITPTSIGLQGHRAENLDDFFVRVSDPTAHSIFKNTSLYICVVCWAKISSASETVTHRKSCKVDPSESDLENGSVPMNMTASKSSSKIENGATAENDISWDNFVRKASSGSRNKSKMTQQLAQCQLCPMVVPSQGQLIHMRDYHRISSGIEQVCEKQPKKRRIFSEETSTNQKSRP